MKARRVRFTATAEHQVERERTWWRKNRDNQEIFEIELNKALEKISFHPLSGRLRKRSRLLGVRYTQVSKIACHLYYTSDDQTITVRALWGARRGSGPAI